MKFAGNSLSDFLVYFRLQLGDLYEENELRSMGRILLEHLFQYDTKYLSLHPQLRFSESELLRIIEFTKALKTGKPIQYVLGIAPFLRREFKVNESVLIPRPETEELVQWIKEGHQQSSPNIMDIGTGSGCIAISLALEIPQSKVVASDISEKALEIARENGRKLDAQVLWIHDNILESRLNEPEKRFDVIVSNPPYVRQSEKENMHRNVLENEPHEALFVPNENALIFYEAITNLAVKILKSGGNIYFEINENLGSQMVNLLSEKFTHIEVRRDLNGKDRMVRATLP